MLAVEALKLHATAAKTKTPKETRSPPLAVRILTPFIFKTGLREMFMVALPPLVLRRGRRHILTLRDRPAEPDDPRGRQCLKRAQVFVGRPVPNGRTRWEQFETAVR